MRKGDRVIATQNLGGMWDGHVDRGTEGVITDEYGMFTSNYDVTFTIPGGFLSGPTEIRLRGLNESQIAKV